MNQQASIAQMYKRRGLSSRTMIAMRNAIGTGNNGGNPGKSPG